MAKRRRRRKQRGLYNKRYTPDEQVVQREIAFAAIKRLYAETLPVWRTCTRGFCRRHKCCTGDVGACLARTPAAAPGAVAGGGVPDSQGRRPAPLAAGDAHRTGTAPLSGDEFRSLMRWSGGGAVGTMPLLAMANGPGFRPRDGGGGGPHEVRWRGRLRCSFVVVGGGSPGVGRSFTNGARFDDCRPRWRRVEARAPSTAQERGPPSPLSRGRTERISIGQRETVAGGGALVAGFDENLDHRPERGGHGRDDPGETAGFVGRVWKRGSGWSWSLSPEELKNERELRLPYSLLSLFLLQCNILTDRRGHYALCCMDFMRPGHTLQRNMTAKAVGSAVTAAFGR